MENQLDRFRSCYGLRKEDVTFVPYGSRVYGTNGSSSDYDYIAVVPENRRADTGTEYSYDDINVHIYNSRHFQDQLERHKIHALEAIYHPSEALKSIFKMKLELPVLRTSLSEKSSHSFVKAKKKLTVEKDYYIGWKSLFHSLRILMFGIQIATKRKIVDFGAANAHWEDIIAQKQTDWNVLNEQYKPIYNELASEFRKVAPKD